MAGRVPSGVAAPVADAVLLQLRQELDAAVAELPGALTSVVPELMVDYLATVFVEQDAQSVERDPVGNGTGTWSLLEGYLSDDPDSTAVLEDLRGMSRAADLARAAIADIQRLEIASTQNLGHLDPRRYRSGDGAQPGCGLVTCSVCKRIMLAGRFKAHGPRCRGPPKEPQPPPPKVPAKRAGLGVGGPQPKRPRGRGRPPPGKSKLCISGKPAPAALMPPSASAAAGGLSMQAAWRAAPGAAHVAALPPLYGAQQTGLPVEVPVEVVPSLQQALEAGAAPSRRRRSAMPRKPRNVEGLAFQSPSPPPAAEQQLNEHTTQQPAGPLAMHSAPNQDQYPAQPSHMGCQAQQLPQPAAVTAVPGQHQQAQQQWRQQQQQQGMPMQIAYAAPSMHGVPAPMQWAVQQQHAVPGSASQYLPQQQQQQQQGQQALPRGGGWVRQVPTSAPAVALVPSSAPGAAAGRHPQAQAQGQPSTAPQHVPLSPAQQAQLQQLQAKVLHQERQKRWAQLSPQQRQQLLMQHSAKRAALAQGGAQQPGTTQRQPAQVAGQVRVPGQAAAQPQHSGPAHLASGATQLPPAPRQQQAVLSHQQMAQHQQHQQLLAQQQTHQRQQQAQQGQQGQQPIQGQTQLPLQAQAQQQQFRPQMYQQQQQQQQQQAGSMANGLSLHSPTGPSVMLHQQPQQQQTNRMQQPASSMGVAQMLVAPLSASQFQYPAAPTAPPHLVNTASASGLPPVRSPTFGGPAAGRTLAEQHFRSTDASALQAVTAQGMPPAKTYSSLKTLSAQLPELATPTGSVPPYAQ